MNHNILRYFLITSYFNVKCVKHNSTLIDNYIYAYTTHTHNTTCDRWTDYDHDCSQSDGNSDSVITVDIYWQDFHHSVNCYAYVNIGEWTWNMRNNTVVSGTLSGTDTIWEWVVDPGHAVDGGRWYIILLIGKVLRPYSLGWNIWKVCDYFLLNI